jgi:hypothetical protein
MPICTNLTKFKFKFIKQSRFEKRFSPDFLEFTLVFLHIFLDFFEFLKISNFELKNRRFLISDQTSPIDFRRISENAPDFFNPGKTCLV